MIILPVPYRYGGILQRVVCISKCNYYINSQYQHNLFLHQQFNRSLRRHNSFSGLHYLGGSSLNFWHTRSVLALFHTKLLCSVAFHRKETPTVRIVSTAASIFSPRHPIVASHYWHGTRSGTSWAECWCRERKIATHYHSSPRLHAFVPASTVFCLL